jgi:hypothetical protein
MQSQNLYSATSVRVYFIKCEKNYCFNGYLMYLKMAEMWGKEEGQEGEVL